jgi:hypothetical protein
MLILRYFRSFGIINIFHKCEIHYTGGKYLVPSVTVIWATKLSFCADAYTHFYNTSMTWGCGQNYTTLGRRKVGLCVKNITEQKNHTELQYLKRRKLWRNNTPDTFLKRLYFLSSNITAEESLHISFSCSELAIMRFTTNLQHIPQLFSGIN